MVIAITGSAKGSVPKEFVFQALVSYIGKGHNWILGGAKGVDQFALEYLMDCAEEFEVIVPGKIGNCTVRPFDGGRSVRETLEEVKLRVTELNHPIPWITPAYLERNNKMVEKCELLLAFPRSDSKSGGTWYTIGKALDEGKSVKIFKCYK